jgi:hypothetical protein
MGTKIQKQKLQKSRNKITKNPRTKIWEQKLQQTRNKNYKIWEQKLQKSENKKKSVGTKVTIIWEQNSRNKNFKNPGTKV